MNPSEEKEVPKYNMDDFHLRWQKARFAAIRKATNDNPIFNFSENSIEGESLLLEKYFSQSVGEGCIDLNSKKDFLLKDVFDHSRALAISFSKYIGLSFELQDFQSLLMASQIPCFQGEWDSRTNAKVLSRKGCVFCVKAGANVCDYWREALDGLVMGLGERERLARHASVRHGDATCIDVFYFDGDEKKEISLHWGPLPQEMATELKIICDDFEKKMKTSVIVKGLSEGILYFEFKSATDALCSGGEILTSAFLRKIQKRYPSLSVQDVTPRAVIGAGV